MTATARSSTPKPATVQFSGARRALALVITRTPPACTFIVGTPSPWYNSGLAAGAGHGRSGAGGGEVLPGARTPLADVQHREHDHGHDTAQDADQAVPGQRGAGVVVQHRLRLQHEPDHPRGGQDQQHGGGLQRTPARPGTVTVSVTISVAGGAGPEHDGELRGDAEGEGQDDDLDDPVADAVDRAGRVVAMSGNEAPGLDAQHGQERNEDRRGGAAGIADDPARDDGGDKSGQWGHDIPPMVLTEQVSPVFLMSRR